MQLLRANANPVNYWCSGEDVRRYVAGPPGPPGPPGGEIFNIQQVAEQVLSLMNGELQNNLGYLFKM